MSREQWGHGYHQGRRDGYDERTAEENLLDTAFAAGAAIVGAGIGFVAGKLLSGGNGSVTYVCRRCGNEFSVQKEASPLCPYCNDNDEDDDEYDEDEYDDDDDDDDDDEW